ncbi:MAG: FUSC family protein [Lachnospiraceae bacterium]|nr:FUSC family protein [Lachnospiraceae bacterium]
MEHKPKRSKFHIGMRNIKTAIAATLCALLYLPFDRNPTFACIGAIFGMGSDIENSWKSGGNRFVGTLIGGFIGMGFFALYTLIYPDGEMHPLMLLFLFIGVVAVVLISQIFEWYGAIPPGGVLLCIILFNTPPEHYVSYSLNRMFDTGIGVLIALMVNILLPREKVVDVLYKLKLRKTK